jgi:predicted nucleic acid-binding protein
MTDSTACGRPRSGPDAIIAAVAEVSDCVVMTDNVKHFCGECG